ncbi:MAG: dihydroorotate dehydrogenase electron transfer subunit [Candidatus Margulisiibacteriota bacterium]
MPIQEHARIIDFRKVTENYCQITLSTKYISANALPGQFVTVRVNSETTPLLRRPFSIYNCSPQREIIDILFDVVGEGTKLLADKEVNDQLDILGPLGKGFEIPQTAPGQTAKNLDKAPPHKIAILVGGGIGIAPLLYLAKTLKGKIPAVYAIIGARSKNHLIDPAEFTNTGAQVLTCTDDGSAGKRGLAPEFIPPILEEAKEMARETVIYACGPRPMLKMCAEIAQQYNVPCQISMEEKMACGVGACMGCVVKTRAGYKKVCDDGPVFKAEEIVW